MKNETRFQRLNRHMKAAALSGASALAVKVGHTHASIEAERNREKLPEADCSPGGLASEP